jgi:predicted type IV restriction endonuclease
MARIVQSLTRASKEYEERTFQSLVRDLDAVITKLNTSFQDEVKQEIEARELLFRLMAVVNQYKFVGIDNNTTGSALAVFPASSPGVNETIIIKSILVTSAGTPSVTVTNNSITALKSVALTANVTTELLTQPLIVEGGSSFTIQSSTSDSFDYAVSYLNIKKEKID